MTQKESSQILLTARKEGTVYLSISLRGHESMGTTVLRLEVEPLTPAFAYPVPHDNVYTGEPITPGCDVRSSQSITLTEGRDYTLGYENNILCGIADLLLVPGFAQPRQPFFDVDLHLRVGEDPAGVVQVDAAVGDTLALHHRVGELHAAHADPYRETL